MTTSSRRDISVGGRRRLDWDGEGKPIHKGLYTVTKRELSRAHTPTKAQQSL